MKTGNNVTASGSAEPKRKKAKKDPILISFSDDEDDAEIEADLKKAFSKDKRGNAAIQLGTKDLAADDQNLLKPEFRHDAKDFFQLFSKPKFIVRTDNPSLTKFVESDLSMSLFYSVQLSLLPRISNRECQ